ncbi:unnamed protein product [Blepharisma stoltei]|uniref:Meckelin n=1 Tax=Blepharisma stoltei TaxID=1481888 RepID=A0AAU9JVH6_9CILI|nr:unnamed protein product [Blepharisma stoltei]
MPALIVFLVSYVLAIQTQISCNSTKYYYNTAIMDCDTCGDNKIASSDWLSCECAPGTYKDPTTNELPMFSCIACSPGAPSSDGYACQTCPNGIDQSTKDCYCSSASYEVVEEFNKDGTYLTEKTCQACSSLNYYPGPGSHSCEQCPYLDIMERDPSTYKCVCISDYTSSAGTCVKNSEVADLLTQFPLESARSVIYNYVETNKGVSQVTIAASDTFNYFYLKSLRDCNNTRSIEACQNLANLCVLQLYNEQSTVCQLYEYIEGKRKTATPSSESASDPGLKEDMAWIYYGNPADDVLDSDIVNMKVTFDSGDTDKINKLQFKLAKFMLNGTFVEYIDLTDQLILCPHSDDDTKNWKTFGTNEVYDCDLDLTPYITYSETVFYDPYLLDQDGSLIDVPVLIDNFIDTNGDKPNKGSDKSSWRLVRRFFIYDNVSGKVGTNAYIYGNDTTVLTYPKSIKLRVTLRTDADSKIYVPLLLIKYRTRLVNYIEQEDKSSHLTFISEYTMNTSGFWKVALAIFIVTNFVLILIWLLKLYIWKKNNPAIISRDGYTMKMISAGAWTFFGVWAFTMFWYLFVFTAYWFIFYKMQYHVYVLIPPQNSYPDDYVAFQVVFGLTVSFQILWVLNIIMTQAKVDFLFIDWETPGRILRPGADQIKAIIGEVRGDPPRPEYYKVSVSAWRTLFVSNELNEIQASRYINIEFTLIFTLLFLSGIGWEELGSAQPNLHTDEGSYTKSPMNMVLRFFIDSFLILVIGYTQFIIRKIISTWVPTQLHNFVDLCAITNISVFILDDALHGYYIHGCSPIGIADITLDELLKGLGKEESGTAMKRGLVPDDPTQLQTFEIYIPWRVRETYNTMTSNATDSDANSYAAAQKLNQASKLWLNRQTTTEPLTQEAMDDIRNQLNNKFKTYITDVIRNNKSQVLEKTPVQRFLSMPPTDMASFVGMPFFYRDIAMGFENIFFMGREFSLLLLDILIFDLIDIAAQNIYIAALVTYVFSKIVVWFRQDLGERNLSRKTLVDRRFLI